MNTKFFDFLWIRTIIIYCVEESENEKLQQKIADIVDRSEAFCEMYFKIWSQEAQLNYTRPIKSSLYNSEHVARFLKNLEV